jgi:ABC-type proline/glycine betaine transport system substrate-binding protein
MTTLKTALLGRLSIVGLAGTLCTSTAFASDPESCRTVRIADIG